MIKAISIKTRASELSKINDVIYAVDNKIKQILSLMRCKCYIRSTNNSNLAEKIQRNINL